MTGAVWQISAQKPVYKKKKKKFYKCQEKILDSNAPFVYDSQGDVMESIVKQSLLYDFYGELLTEHQKKIYEDVVYNDFSLSEIAEENGISRQGVHDLIRRCNKILQEYENKLHLIERFVKIREEVGSIQRLAENPQISKEELIGKVNEISHRIIEEL